MSAAGPERRPFWPEAPAHAEAARDAARLDAALGDALDAAGGGPDVGRLTVFVPDPPPSGTAAVSAAVGAEAIRWGRAGQAFCTGDAAVAREAIAPAFGLGADWLYVLALPGDTDTALLPEALARLIEGDRALAGPHVLMAFEWGDFAPPPWSSVDWQP